MRQAIILAGGKGTRLAERLHGLPKPLVSIAGQPLLQRQLLLLKNQGIKRVLLLVNHRADAISAFCREHGDFGLDITFANDGVPRGTAGAVLAALPQLPEGADDLLVLYGDTLFNVDLSRLFNFHECHDGAATLFLHPNDHPQDSDLVELDGTGRIMAVHPYPHPEHSEFPNLVNAALYVVKRSALAQWAHFAQEAPHIIDFAKVLFPRMLAAGQHLYGYCSPEYIKDVGTPARLDSAEADIASGRYSSGSLATPKAAVFLDRDGVINHEVGFLNRKEDFVLLPGAARALRRLNQSGMLSVVVTNQPVIARGECTEHDLAVIHAHMDMLLGQEGAYVDRLYYCPHHPDKGFVGERPELKMVCDCRKPGIGMLERAKVDLHIDYTCSWLVGDRTGDIQTAHNVGMRSVLVRTGDGGRDALYPVKPDFVADDLEAAVDLILCSPS